MSKLGEFEMLVLLSILRHKNAPYANRIREDLEQNAARPVTRGALYRTIDRLTEKGFLSWELEPMRIGFDGFRSAALDVEAQAQVLLGGHGLEPAFQVVEDARNGHVARPPRHD